MNMKPANSNKPKPKKGHTSYGVKVSYKEKDWVITEAMWLELPLGFQGLEQVKTGAIQTPAVEIIADPELVKPVHAEIEHNAYPIFDVVIAVVKSAFELDAALHGQHPKLN